MVFRLLITSFFIVTSFVYTPVVGADSEDEEVEWRVEDVTPEMLARTLPPQDDNNKPNGNDDKPDDREDMPLASAQAEANKTGDPTLQQLIQTLENDSQRQDLLTVLKTLNNSQVLTSQQFVFINIFSNIKFFIKSVISELRNFLGALTKKSTWSLKFNSQIFANLKHPEGKNLLYILLAALVAQIGSAVAMGASLPPFFKGLEKNMSAQNGVRTAISLFVFLVVGLFSKIYFIKSPEIIIYAEEAILMFFMIQLGLILLRLSIATGVLPVNPEYRTSLFGVLVVMICLLGGYAYSSHFISINSQTVQVSQPLAQLFWATITIFGFWIIRHYRHVIDGMVFRKLPSSENQLLGDLRQGIAGSVHYVIMVGLALTYIAWFTHNQPMFVYLRDQLLITFGVLVGLSLLTFLMSSSAVYITSSAERGYLSIPSDQNNRMLVVTHRLIDVLAVISVGYILYRWIAPLLEMQGVSTAKFSDKLFGIFLIVALTIFVFHLLSRLFNGSISGIKENKHLKTFLPIIDRLTKLVVFVIATLLILNELNVNIMPIVASFSVLGLGIGLASKSIIEDFINGLFIIQENDFNIGDTVTINGITGTIENITLRKLHLRDGQGFINFIPFSNVGFITNRSRGFNAEKINIPLPSNFHLKRTVHILEDVGQQLLHDPDLKGLIISAPHFVGISEFQNSAHPNTEVSTMMQFEIKTVPGKLHIVTGEFRKLAKLAFEEMERVM